jgi:hypothetical protein
MQPQGCLRRSQLPAEGKGHLATEEGLAERYWAGLSISFACTPECPVAVDGVAAVRQP